MYATNRTLTFHSNRVPCSPGPRGDGARRRRRLLLHRWRRQRRRRHRQQLRPRRPQRQRPREWHRRRELDQVGGGGRLRRERRDALHQTHRDQG